MSSSHIFFGASCLSILFCHDIFSDKSFLDRAIASLVVIFFDKKTHPSCFDLHFVNA